MPQQSKLFSLKNFSLIHIKSQAYAHILFGMPMGVLAVYSWGLPLSAPIGVAVYYMYLYFFIYMPFYVIYPRIYMRKFIPHFQALEDGTADEAVARKALLKFSRLPIRHSIQIFFIELSAFAAGALIWSIGLVPELMQIIGVSIFETFVLGIVVGIYTGLLNYGLLDKKCRQITSHLLEKYPSIPTLEFKSHFTITRKIYLLIILISFSGQVAVILFFTSYLATQSSEAFVTQVIYIILILFFSMLFVLNFAPLMARLFTDPIDIIINWIKNFKSTEETYAYGVANDEIQQLYKSVNIMQKRIYDTQFDLTNSKAALISDRTILNTERNKMNSVLGSIGDGIVAVDIKGNIVLMNQSAQKILRWDQDSAIGKHIDEVITVHNIDHERLFFGSIDVGTSLVQKHYGKEDEMYNLINGVQEEKHVKLKVSRLKKTRESYAAAIVTIKDLTDEQSLEDMKLDFVSIAAHELRSPLTAINGYLSVLIKEGMEGLSAEHAQHLNRIHSSARDLDTLVENLLLITKIERGMMRLQLSEFNMSSMVKSIIEEFMFNATRKNINLVFSRSENDEEIIEADKIKVQESLRNILSNAINFTENGGRVSIEVEYDKKSVTVIVTDTGVGIPKYAINNIFTKFYRVENDLRDEDKGTGLGLYIAKSIIDLHHGDIWLKSEEFKGTTVSLRIPKRQIFEQKEIKKSVNYYSGSTK